jgi:uncharacterized protein (DUF1330 family)
MIVFAHVHDRARFLEAYARPTAELIGRFGGEYLVRAPASVALENASQLNGAAAVVSKWPDRASIERFWNSEDYRALKAKRQPLADAHVLIVEDPS